MEEEQHQQRYIEVAKVHEIQPGNMKHIEVEGKELVISNVEGKFYALSDRCGHMNAPLSMGSLKENIITCPFHGVKFDVTNGRKLSEPILSPSQEMEPLPKTWQKFMENAGQLMSHIKTHNQGTYEVQIVDDTVRVKI